MDKKQTAVEWLKEQLKENMLTTAKELDELFEQAKATEKQQIIDAFAIAVLKVNSDYIGMHEETSASIYYNETYDK